MPFHTKFLLVARPNMASRCPSFEEAKEGSLLVVDRRTMLLGYFWEYCSSKTQAMCI